MFLAHIKEEETYAPLLRGEIWRHAIGWIQRQERFEPGIVELRGKDMFVNVHGYDTKARENCRYESHRRYVDLQYCISGGELIEWRRIGALTEKDEYDEVKDVIHYHSPWVKVTELRMEKGMFGVFFPPDGHMPKISYGEHSHVEKLVIKIARELLG